MPPSAPRPLWGWTTPIRLWLAAFGAIVALSLIAREGARVVRSPAVPPAAPRLVVDPNTAPPGVLLALPHLGPALVGRIVAARGAAPFRSVDDLGRRVRGVGPSTLAALRPFLDVGPADAPADPDDLTPRAVRVARAP